MDSRPLVLMRHDIDFDLGAALAMARVECEEGVQSTYFFLLRTLHYNVFSKEGTAEVQQILHLGHHLGLHFDCAAYPAVTDMAGLAAACRREVRILESWFARKVSIVSYHRPNALVLTGDPALSAPLPHTYMPRFTTHMKYCSDSRGEWRYGDPRSTPEFAARVPMHILIHPIWWSQNPKPASKTLSSWLSTRVDVLDDSIAQNCTAYRRKKERYLIAAP